MRIAFTVWGAQPRRADAHRWDVAAGCNGCGGPLLVTAHTPSHANLDVTTLGFDLANHPDVRIEAVWPEPLPADAPLHVPPRVAGAFIEAATCRRHREYLPTAACAMYRRALEVAVQAALNASPAPVGRPAATLQQRIDRLADAHLLTPAMRDWAHELRLDGNEALHGAEPATKALADQMHAFTESLLNYLFTLPEQVRLARQRRHEAG